MKDFASHNKTSCRQYTFPTAVRIHERDTTPSKWNYLKLS